LKNDFFGRKKFITGVVKLANQRPGFFPEFSDKLTAHF